MLSTASDIEVRFARRSEIAVLADMANRMVPGIQTTAAILGRYLEFDPECILTFGRRSRLLGAVALLYLNVRGHDALILDDICIGQPEPEFLARPDEEVSATYIWAIAATGRGIAGYGKVAAHLRTPRYVNADCFAQPSSRAGRELFRATGFRPIPSFQPNLWCYERPWNRLPSAISASNIPARSMTDARH